MTYESMYTRFFLENETKFQSLPKYTIFVLLQISTLHIDTRETKEVFKGEIQFIFNNWSLYREKSD
jgi:hypothetical protein